MTEDRLALAFLGTFESLRMGPTFARGRRDERAGHVRQLTISGSLAVALVRGPDDPRAFRARIAVRSFGAAEWARVAQALVAEARFAADLLAGRMPEGIGSVFAAEGLSLVPLSLDEVAMDCGCERWPMPCVHLAATCYALARSFEEDPFGVFAWRGRGRDELLLHLRELRSAAALAPPVAGLGRGRPAGDDFGRPGADAGPATARSGAAGAVVAEYGDAAAGGSEPGGPESDGSAHAGSELGGSARDPASPVSGSAGDEGPAGDGDLGWFVEFWGGGAGPAVAAGGRPGAVSRPDALLDQLDPPPLAQGGRPVVDLLRPAYLALPEA